MVEKSQKLSENTGGMLNNYPASLKTIKSVDNRTEDKNNTWKSREGDCGGEKDVKVKSIDGKIEYNVLGKAAQQIMGKTSQKLSE